MAIHRLHHLHNSLVRKLLRPDLGKLQIEKVRSPAPSVEGFNLDYLVLNISGYTFYAIYSSLGYFTDMEGAGTVVIADLVFVYHGIVMIAIEAVQCCIYEVPL